jgi:hypothetical protein
MSSKIVVSVIGAGGKMGTRVSNNLAKHPESIDLHFCENSPAGVAAIEARGFSVVAPEEAVPKSDIVVLAVPDVVIKKVSVGIVALLKPGATLIILDPAAAVARELALREDCTFAVTHPCHPSFYIHQETPEARADAFGGIAAKQDLVMAKIQGDDAKFADAKKVSELMFAPVRDCFVMSIRDIAFLEPTLVEILGASTLYAMAETVDEAERRGISREAAISFLTGHINVLLSIFLGRLGKAQVSDACKVAVGLGNRLVLREDWKRIWSDDVLDKAIATMLHPENPQV